MKKLPNLDPLRFLLASLVLIFHVPKLFKNQGLPNFGDYPIFNKGTQAVYMFFVLSGFLIIRLIFIEKRKGTFSISKFYMRRILRIFPLYYFIVIFGLVFYNLILPFLKIPFENNYTMFEAITLNTFFLPNVFARLYKPGGILEILWSIGIEEQFYLLIAPLMLFIKKTHILKTLILITIVYFCIFHIIGFEFLSYYLLVYFFFLFGGIVAILAEEKYLEFLKKYSIIPIMILIITLIFFTTNWLSFNNRFLDNLFMSICFPLCIHSLAYNNRGVIIKNKFLNYLGSISYGIYMFHSISIYIIAHLFKTNLFFKALDSDLLIVFSFVFTFIITLIFAHISYKYFESYFLRLKNKFR